MSGSIGLTVFADAALSGMTAAQLEDAIEYVSPDAIAVPRPAHEMAIRAALPGSVPIVVVERPPRRARVACTSGAVDLVRIPTVESLARLPELERSALSVSGETYLLSDLLAVDIDLVNLDTTLEGRQAYESAVRGAELSGSYTHLTTEANPNYRKEWGSLRVQGTMPGANERQGQQQPGIAHLQLQSDGLVSTETLAPGKFGLQSIGQVGPARARVLREAGFTSREAVAGATIHELREAADIGRETARMITRSATATVEGEPFRFSDEGFPAAEPVFIDIETDGLNPTRIWLVGVLDRQGEETYRSFLAREPDSPGAAVEALVEWLRSETPGRPVVAYNGRSFDFPVIEEQLAEHCPEKFDVWENVRTFDPYHWAREGGAVLPGRTNRLADVAAALGWKGEATGLTGQAVARLFRRWLENPCEETELDWERHERYCEDDVRALAHVYDALAGAASTAGRKTGGRTGEGTTQGQLSDF